jgi:hypothetical protein
MSKFLMRSWLIKTVPRSTVAGIDGFDGDLQIQGQFATVLDMMPRAGRLKLAIEATKPQAPFSMSLMRLSEFQLAANHD